MVGMNDQWWSHKYDYNVKLPTNAFSQLKTKSRHGSKRLNRTCDLSI